MVKYFSMLLMRVFFIYAIYMTLNAELSAQDQILTKGGTKHNCKITSVDSSLVYFKYKTKHGIVSSFADRNLIETIIVKDRVLSIQELQQHLAPKSLNSKDYLLWSICFTPQHTRYYEGYLEQIIDIDPKDTWKYSLNFNIYPHLTGNLYLDLGLVLSHQGQKAYSEWSTSNIERDLTYLKFPILLSIRTKNFLNKKISLNFEFGPQFSFLVSEDFSESGSKNSYEYIMPEFNEATVDIAGKLTILYKISNNVFFTTGIRADQTITSPNPEANAYARYYGTVKTTKLNYYNKTFGIMFGFNFLYDLQKAR